MKARYPFKTSPRKMFKDVNAEMKAWLYTPNLTQAELRHRQEAIHLRLALLDKIDEDYYLKRYITLRTQ
ncbi:hypothetical protein KR074_006596 [Drosophila pseudoananassae]|nr:hypothetical protein KR074_006596 [Drosophila pseudoananassae]